MATHLEINESEFMARFPEEPFLVRHALESNPLFQLPRLIELFRALPAENVEYNAGNLEVNQDPSKTPRTGLSVEETIQRIEECQSWLVLKYVENDPDYRRLLDECIDQVAQLSERKIEGSDQREGFIFISSPGAVTPYHMDPEHNFLLQVRGLKTIHIFDGRDRSLVSEAELERFYEGKSHRNMEFKDEYQAKAQTYQLEPGMGLYFPIADPHWVKVHDNVSISFSITFRSSYSQRRARLYQANARLRRIGLAPSPIGESPGRDSAKDLVYRALRKTERVLGLADAPKRAY